MMKVVIPIWQGRISPVFDAAGHMLVIDIEDGIEIKRYTETIHEMELTHKVKYIVDLGVDLLICGAISRPLEVMLLSAGIQIISQTCGNVEEVLSAYMSGKLTEQVFLMPGCRKRFRHGQWNRVDINEIDFRDKRKSERTSMKVAVSSYGQDMTSEVDPRFGRAKFFILVDIESGELTVHENTQNLNAVQGAGIQAARNVLEFGADAVITGNVGPKAFTTLKAGNVGVYTGASGPVEDAIAAFKAEQLECASEANVEGHWA